jgi:hypothetical protein
MSRTLYFKIRVSIDDKTKLEMMSESMKLPPEEIIHRLIGNNFKAARLEWPPEPKTTKLEKRSHSTGASHAASRGKHHD